MFGEVPALPVVAPLAAAVCAVLLRRLHRRGELTVPRALVAVAVCVYGAGVVANTVFPIFLDKPGGPPPWSSSISIRLFVDYDMADAVQNVVVFVPLGTLVCLVAGTRSPWRVTGLGVVCSLLIETAQLVSDRFFAGGHVADVNDFFFNAVGAAVGCGLFVIAGRAPVLAGRIRRMQWPSACATGSEEDREDTRSGRTLS